MTSAFVAIGLNSIDGMPSNPIEGNGRDLDDLGMIVFILLSALIFRWMEIAAEMNFFPGKSLPWVSSRSTGHGAVIFVLLSLVVIGEIICFSWILSICKDSRGENNLWIILFLSVLKLCTKEAVNVASIGIDIYRHFPCLPRVVSFLYLALVFTIMAAVIYFMTTVTKNNEEILCEFLYVYRRPPRYWPAIIAFYSAFEIFSNFWHLLYSIHQYSKTTPENGC
mmetsp:Transcript_18398/g.22528  ORF Transcript_18398/g.22528 Transcript_18398/m.22528 type:complete len:223 (+) Transcript_18398:800-1468(+)